MAEAERRYLPGKIRRSAGERMFNGFNILFMIVLAFITLYPFYYVLCASFSQNSRIIANNSVLFWPLGFNVGAYRLAFKHPLLLSGYANTLFILGVGLPLNFIMTMLCAYFMASEGMMFKKQVIMLFMFTMFFGGGLIPSFLNIRDLGLYNTLWALIIPGCLSLYNAIITKTSIEAIPDALTESAHIDGASDFTVLIRILIPLITPTIAVIMLYYAVGHWNSWFPATIYIKKNELMPLQAILRDVQIMNTQSLGSSEIVDARIDSYSETIKHSIVIISTVPILCVYPFLQKYFVKGVMIGAIKG